METSISLDGIQMHAISTDDSGEVNAETLFTFAQTNSLISAQYTGGKVRLGYLVGTMTTDGSIQFRYAQIDNNGRLDSGYSTGEVSRIHDGRIRLLEHFKWDSRPESGTNIFEEIPANSSGSIQGQA